MDRMNMSGMGHYWTCSILMLRMTAYTNTVQKGMMVAENSCSLGMVQRSSSDMDRMNMSGMGLRRYTYNTLLPRPTAYTNTVRKGMMDTASSSVQYYSFRDRFDWYSCSHWKRWGIRRNGKYRYSACSTHPYRAQ